MIVRGRIQVDNRQKRPIMALTEGHLSSLMMQPKPLRLAASLTTEETRAWLGISKSNLYRLLAVGGIPHIRVGRLYRIPENQLRAWVEASTQGAGNVQEPQAKLERRSR